MTRAELLEMFRSMASEIAEKDFSHVAEDAAIKDLGIDSLGMLELVGEMERTLEVRIPDDNLVGVQTVRQLLELVERRLRPIRTA
ncbi:MAG: phosphopantetheine-binding protein [Proteobacteria bacterium]|nr:phosphopantetheine-binding protein [Pseudomonadota bacterium]